MSSRWLRGPGQYSRFVFQSLLATLALLSTSLQTLAGEAAGDGEVPNVLVVYVDDLGYGDTAAYGHPLVHTPTIDRLATEGVRFTQCYAPSALCSPSRAGLLTGRTPYRTGVEDWIPDGSAIALGANETTLADLAKGQGYRTAVIGKWHLNGGLELEEAPQPRDFGFDFQYGLGAWVKNAAVAARRSSPRRGHMYPDNMYRNNRPVGRTEKYSAELVSDEALAWLSRGESPFFLYLTYSEVHTPIASPQRWLDYYDAFLTDEARENPLVYYFDWRNRPWRGRGEYYANISFLDEQLGRVIEHLRASGQLDNTLVVFSSDNGPVTAAALTPWELGMAGETAGLRGKKRLLFEGGIRVPGILRYPPMLRAGRILDEPATALDILPTVADVMGAQLDEHVPLDGQSLVPLLRGQPWHRSQPLYWSIKTPDGMEYAIRDGDWKLILDSAAEPVYFFNLNEDFYEVDNRLTQEPDRVAKLLEAFRAQRASVEADPLRRARDAYQATP